jgi:hypothetical protein
VAGSTEGEAVGFGGSEEGWEVELRWGAASSGWRFLRTATSACVWYAGVEAPSALNFARSVPPAPPSLVSRDEGPGASSAGELARLGPRWPLPLTPDSADSGTTRATTDSGRQYRTANRRLGRPSHRRASVAPRASLTARRRGARVRRLLRPVPPRAASATRTATKETAISHPATPRRRNRRRARLRGQVPPLSAVSSRPRSTSCARDGLDASQLAMAKTLPPQTQRRLSRCANAAPIGVCPRMPPPAHLVAPRTTLQSAVQRLCWMLPAGTIILG